MKFKDFLNILFTYCSKGKSKYDFFIELTDNFVGSSIDENLNPFTKFQSNTIGKYYKGNPLNKSATTKLYSNRNINTFSEYIKSFGDNVMLDIEGDIRKYIPSFNEHENCIAIECFYLFADILSEILNINPDKCETITSAKKDIKTKSIELPNDQTSEEYPYSLDDKTLLKEFTKDFDEIMFSMIGENYATSLIDMTLPHKTKDLYNNKWDSKADAFKNPTLKSYVFGLLGELNTLSTNLLLGDNKLFFIKKTRTKIRNLYVKLHPDSFAGAFPYDAFIDDWNDGDFY